MTREEQAQLIEKLVTELAKSRTCENCKHGEVEDLGIYCHFVNYCGSDYMDKDFGCLKFERKDK